MTGDDKTRHCDLCELSVHNFSGMTRGEISDLIKSSGGRVCGRMFRRADGTVITRDCPVGLRGVRKRAAKYYGAALAAILGLFSFSSAQTKDAEKCESNVDIVRKTVDKDGGTIIGAVLDLNGAVIPGATITLYQGDKKMRTFTADDNGIFKIEKVPGEKFSILIEAQNFIKQKIVELAVRKDEIAQIDVKLSSGDTYVTIGILIEPSYDATPATERVRTRTNILKLPVGHK